MNKLFRAVETAHLFLSQILREGQTAVDATCGNGHDTLFLARKVGPQGRVYAFDIQGEALEKTEALLKQHSCRDWVRLIHDSHANLVSYVQEEVHAVLYNLGYLPGGDKSIATTGQATLSSLRQATGLLAPGGVLAVVTYSGHPGGAEEAGLAAEYLGGLVSPPWHVLTWKRLNGSTTAPALIIAHKQGQGRRNCLEN